MSPHEPLSASLLRLADGEGPQTFNDLIARTEGRGLYLVMILMCLPFVSPVPVPGLSNVFGVVLLIMSLRLAMGRPAQLPRFLGERQVPVERMRKVIRGSLGLVRFVERWVRPRKARWLTRPVAIRAHALLLAFMALLLALPIPPIIPFSNSLPSWGIIFVSAAMMEEDGRTIWIGYLASLVAVAYLASFVGLLIRLFMEQEERLGRFLRELL